MYVSVRRAYSCSSSRDLDLNTSHVELSTTGWVNVEGGVRLVVSEDLVTQEIFSVGEVGWELDGVLSLGSNELVDSPLAVGVTVLGDLDPNVTNTIGRSWGKVGDERTLVGLRVR